VAHSLFLFGAIVLVLFSLFFLAADYGREVKKRRPFKVEQGDSGAVNGGPGRWWYSWVRYLAVILLTYITYLWVFDPHSGRSAAFTSPSRVLCLGWVLLLFSIALLATDGYWDLKLRRGRGLSGPQRAAFWSYFVLRYPLLIVGTMQVIRRGLFS
jgi:hypothetical protein